MEDFLKDMTANERANYELLPAETQEKCFRYWTITEGDHFEYETLASFFNIVVREN